MNMHDKSTNELARLDLTTKETEEFGSSIKRLLDAAGVGKLEAAGRRAGVKKKNQGRLFVVGEELVIKGVHFRVNTVRRTRLVLVPVKRM